MCGGIIFPRQMLFSQLNILELQKRGPKAEVSQQREETDRLCSSLNVTFLLNPLGVFGRQIRTGPHWSVCGAWCSVLLLGMGDLSLLLAAGKQIPCGIPRSSVLGSAARLWAVWPG